jgi:hypothetical protein
MKATLILLISALAPTLAIEPEKPRETEKAGAAKVLVQLKFVPNGGPWKGETPFQGASWSALQPMFEKNTLTMQAHAGIGDKFPVEKKDGTKLFDVVLENGTDDHLVLGIYSEEEDQKIKVTRAKATDFTVAGAKYQAQFPRSRVMAEKGETPTTNKATIFVKQRP